MPARPATTPRPTARPPRSSDRSAPRHSWRTSVACALGPPLFIYLALGSYLVNVVQLLGLAVGLGLIAVFAARPALTLRLLVLIVPVQLVLSALLYQVVPIGPVIRMFGLWKEAGVAGLAIAAVIGLTNSGRTFDALDRACLAFLGLSVVFMVAPAALLGPVGGPISLDIRFTAWRGTVVPVVLFLSLRHLRLTGSHVRRAVRLLCGWGAAFAALAVVELLLSSTWNWLLVDVVGINRYRLEVLDLASSAFLTGVDEIRAFTSFGVPRIGGIVLSALTLSFFLLVVFAFLVERVVRGEAPMRVRVVLALVVLSLVATQTRSSLAGMLVIADVALRPVAGRSEAARARFAALLVVSAVALAPLLLGAGIVSRFTGGDDLSDRSHASSTALSASEVLENPLGQGFGMGVDGVNAGVPGALVSENQFLDVALQVGVVGMVLYVGIYVGAIRRLGHVLPASAHDPDVQLHGYGIRNALLGLLVPCTLLQPFETPAIGWLVFALAGAALGAAERSADDHIRR
jgi:hypothetical protein